MWRCHTEIEKRETRSENDRLTTRVSGLLTTKSRLQGQTHLQHRLCRYVRHKLIPDTGSPMASSRVGLLRLRLRSSKSHVGPARRLPRIRCISLDKNQRPQLTESVADENAKLTDCYYEKKDWRACKDQVSGNQLCSPQSLSQEFG